MGSYNTQPQPEGAPDITPQGFNPSATDTTLSEALITIRKRRRVFVVCILLGLLFGIYKAKSQPKLYDAAGRIQVRSGSSNEYRVSNIQGYGSDQSSTKLLSEIEIIKSDTLMLAVAREMDLNNNPEFLESKKPVPHTSLDDGEVRQDTIHRLQSSLSVGLVPKTDIIQISYLSLNPQLSAEIVNKVIATYIHHSFETRFASTQRVSNWLASTLDDLKQQVETSQEQMMDLQRRLGILGFDPTHNQITTSLDDLARAQGQAKLARIIAEARYRILNGIDPDSMEGTLDTSTPGVAPPVELSNLRTQLATAKANYAQLEATLGPRHPQAKALKAQIDELTKEIKAEESRLLTQAKQNYVVAKANEDQTTAALETQKTDAYKLRDLSVEYTLREREFEANRTLYDSLKQRLRTASVESGLESLEIDIVDQAMPPARPLLRSQSTIILTMLVFGLIGGVIVAFLLESLDTGLRSIGEIEAITGLPSLAVIPRTRRAPSDQTAAPTQGHKAIEIISQPKSQFAESFRALRTALLLSSAGAPPRMLVLTSAAPSEGKTTAASNLAGILAQHAKRVLLIDADLRRPNLHHRFGLPGKIGLTSVLSGSATLSEAVQQVPDIPTLYLLPSGPIPPFPTEMLSSDTMVNILAQCREQYDFVVIDTPPVLSVTDGVIVARYADAVLLIVRHGKSSKHVVRRARDLLARSGARITGVVLNAIDLNSPEYYGYYGYGNYSYGSVDAESWESRPAEKDTTATGDRR